MQSVVRIQSDFMSRPFGTGTVSDITYRCLHPLLLIFRPAGIIEDLDLLRPIYAKTAAYGHFGRPISGADLIVSLDSRKFLQ